MFVKDGIVDLANVRSMNKKILNLLMLCDELTTKELIASIVLPSFLVMPMVKLVLFQFIFCAANTSDKLLGRDISAYYILFPW